MPQMDGIQQASAGDNGRGQQKAEAGSGIARHSPKQAGSNRRSGARDTGHDRSGLGNAHGQRVSGAHLSKVFAARACLFCPPHDECHHDHQRGHEYGLAEGLFGLSLKELADDCAGNGSQH